MIFVILLTYPLPDLTKAILLARKHRWRAFLTAKGRNEGVVEVLGTGFRLLRGKAKIGRLFDEYKTGSWKCWDSSPPITRSPPLVLALPTFS